MTQTEHRNSAPLHNAQQAPQPAELGAPENLNRAGRYDLHIHSAISDGTQSLTELVPLIARTGLAGFALTDHDTTAGWAQAAQLADEHGLDFLPGAEF
ncbi:PHP domain-containing protein, partial [uncultured Rothia sp.]|uniref:PHP domain-containing protein n=1 Tax=uncultured Rothia sp. TaxID=316088 RepID=UPI00260C293B